MRSSASLLLQTSLGKANLRGERRPARISAPPVLLLSGIPLSNVRRRAATARQPRPRPRSPPCPGCDGPMGTEPPPRAVRALPSSRSSLVFAHPLLPRGNRGENAGETGPLSLLAPPIVSCFFSPFLPSFFLSFPSIYFFIWVGVAVRDGGCGMMARSLSELHDHHRHRTPPPPPPLPAPSPPGDVTRRRDLGGTRGSAVGGGRPLPSPRRCHRAADIIGPRAAAPSAESAV